MNKEFRRLVEKWRQLCRENPVSDTQLYLYILTVNLKDYQQKLVSLWPFMDFGFSDCKSR